MTPRWFGFAPLLILAVLALPAAASTRDSTAQNLVVIEFVESPPTGLSVSGGLLGVPDSSGRFPEAFRRFDNVTGQHAPPGRVAGDLLLFTDLRPGTYRLAMVFLEESKLARRLLPKGRQALGDRCTVYSDSIPALTFTIAPGEVVFLGRLARRTLPSMEDKNELWKTWVEWSGGDTRKALKQLLKRKELSPWRGAIAARLAALEAPGAEQVPRR